MAPSLVPIACVLLLACGNGGQNRSHTAGGDAAVPQGGRSPTGTTGGSTATGGATWNPTATEVSCTFDTQLQVSSAIATVGIVLWSTTLPHLSNARVVYELTANATSVNNRGGTAPVDLRNPGYRTLLLGLKANRTYTVHIDAQSSGGTACTSPDYSITTGALPHEAPIISQRIIDPSALVQGFIVTSGGMADLPFAYVIDADGEVVWWTEAPTNCSRARVDYEATNLWMIGANAMNTGGELRSVSLDGLTSQRNVDGFARSHHDFAVLPGGAVAALCWSSSGLDVQSDIVERAADGTLRTAFRIGSDVYAGAKGVLTLSSNAYHTNSIAYHAADDSYTLGDRNPSLYVKTTRSGAPLWQIGGNCSDAPAPACSPGAWEINHGHDIAASGSFLLFSNASAGGAHVFELELTGSTGSVTARELMDYVSQDSAGSGVLGDVQRLPNGNTLVTYSSDGLIQELDSAWNVVRTLTTVEFGYADWRRTLYGPPDRL